jgi:radical SAM protein with 4Fe4S-binding SPASM domain
MNQLSATLDVDILERIRDGKRKKIKVYPQHVVRASEIGHDCERYLVYSITNWQDKSPYDVGLQFVFDGGNLVEDLAINDFIEAGFKVYRPEPDKAIAEARPAITGHIDVRVDFGDGKPVTGEIKGLNKYDFDSLNCLQDFFTSKKVHIRKYPAQLMTYLYMKGEERGFFYLKSIPGFQPKIIWIDLDYSYMESILQKTERIEEHIKNKTLPDQINDYDICQRCGFLHICLPPCKVKALEFEEDFVAERLDKLASLGESIEPLQEEYDEIYKEIKALAIQKERFMAGNWLVVNKKIEKKAFTAPASSYSKVSIKKLIED